MDEIVNRVAASGLITIDLEELFPSGDRVLYDLAQNLWQGLVLKEKDFRTFIKEKDWTEYAGKHVAIVCSEDAIVPAWASMLLATKLQNHAQTVFFGSLEEMEVVLFDRMIQQLSTSDYSDARVVIKGCSKLPVPQHAYVALTAKLVPVVKSLLFGEPCSTVPLYKQPKK